MWICGSRLTAMAVASNLPVVTVMRDPKTKIMSRAALCAARERCRSEGRKVVFTNGCFDLIHAGHVDYLAFARSQGDALIVGLNSDASVRRAKGPTRPIVAQDDRAYVMASLEAVDFVVIFDEDEPAALIAALLPDVLVKGADWAHYVSGRDIVEAHGGRVALAPLVPGRSTTDIVGRILSTRKPQEGMT